MRIHFTVSDLARTRLAPAPSPLAAVTFSIHRLAHGPGTPGLDLWRRAVRAAGVPPEAGALGALTAGAASHPVPRFLRPHEGLPSLEEELDRLLSTPRVALRRDLAYVAAHRALPAWTHDLADGDRAAATRLAGSIRAYHRVAVAPYWRGLSRALGADHALRARQLREGGIEVVLNSLRPGMRWRPPVLEIEMPGDLQDYHLDGRGLLLAPAAFSSYIPCDPSDDQPTLYYEAASHPLTSLNGPHTGLAALLGHSRAAVLEVIADGVSTGQLARRAGLSPASASEHATVLRRVGLVATHRTGRTAHHTLTPLGSELLVSAAAHPDGPRSRP
ncbi:ArsR/SmtB family transcription factor [Streptomyces iconiensis]|uniref:Winged helix-turn-helix domain-containing protein n=1 Tax=Streptomyces iconiensis TaxID=1384038 RepID=A0ABT6ZRY1_9ACTN|nr:winged helix-turn-helix domain-containing protein [Streptomyces iconiensis]MDJ1131823.1 winged helix-turn-helix domain-containing protein [Streptomyces iconiensis]